MWYLAELGCFSHQNYDAVCSETRKVESREFCWYFSTFPVGFLAKNRFVYELRSEKQLAATRNFLPEISFKRKLLEWNHATFIIITYYFSYFTSESIEHEILSLRFVALIIAGKLMQFLVYWSETDWLHIW